MDGKKMLVEGNLIMPMYSTKDWTIEEVSRKIKELADANGWGYELVVYDYDQRMSERGAEATAIIDKYSKQLVKILSDHSDRL